MPILQLKQNEQNRCGTVKGIDNNAPFEPQQQQILTALKQSFEKSEHATVWYEIIRQQHTLSNQMQQHLQQVPELLIP